MSDWSAVDAAPDPTRLVAGLDTLRSDPFFAQSKERIHALVSEAEPTRILDIGCGTGDDAAELAATAIGIERSTVMCAEARARHRDLPILTADAMALPIADGCVDAVRADRVVQHLADAPAALREWRRVLTPGGSLVCFDPDLTTAQVDGVDSELAAIVFRWRLNTATGAPTVSNLEQAFGAAGFVDVGVEPLLLDLTDLNQADGMLGLATWGHAAAGIGLISPDDAQRWSNDVRAAARDGTLRYRCTYRVAVGRGRAMTDVSIERDGHWPDTVNDLLRELPEWFGIEESIIAYLEASSGDSDENVRTRAFYEALGFLPLEERSDIWGPENPCLILVKLLA